MKRIKEEFISKIENVFLLKDSVVLEIGCGNGSRSVALGERSLKVTAIEPNSRLIAEAIKINKRDNIEYRLGSAETLSFDDNSFDVTIFTLSFHHIPLENMVTAINEAIRVTKPEGYIVFLEPTFTGSFFEAEILFDACDGDERKEKARAYYEILNFKDYREIAEISDETVFKFDSLEDFVSTFSPKKKLSQLSDFLETNSYTLTAARRINIFQV